MSGGPDSGMRRAYSLTISCLDCQELYDVPWLEPHSGDHPGEGLPMRWKQLRLRCPEDREHQWEPFEGRCPVCRTPLDVHTGGMSVHWD
ncbi:hypothetical protein [Deinococcus sp. QL22]|uniref:hypothetical protein n=1 Tax=Deinococcus sp. QL22 TaxID=2939437 RepID=UPI002016F7BF|nr:hypothetical protein [Deinococcus sp. QL22]UQN08429.1 hypothetical protein M1R55_17045 [Deinococcus sp. QL22]